MTGNGLSIVGATCAVCGSRELRIDAVDHGGWLLLSECARCDHRWTQPFAGATARAVKVSAEARRTEVANAA
jgi:hypothetical protein